MLTGLLPAIAACTGTQGPSDRATMAATADEAALANEDPAAPVGNARYAGTRMLSPHSGCSFLSSPVNFCDERHRALIERVIAERQPNFNGRYIVAELDEWPEFFQRSVVVINASTGIVYPLPIDALSGPLSAHGRSATYGTVETSLDATQFCLVGAVLAYRSINDGRFCFGFDDGRFTGHVTPYMQ
ncbi:hypothetical protein [Stenotrophomonas sp.]|uniref:hypothetical protein n=1 Tax=Stenotrophomonas sp. TaxID=69392 RepID=UPI0028A763D1|nr:hypothetical protein [Stenotrophomonas sp.]